MDYQETLEYINSSAWFSGSKDLCRITELLARLGNPQDTLRFIHIAGTNGKGSCAAMTASVLRAAGYKTGLFTSPYIYRFNERMQINGEEIEEVGVGDGPIDAAFDAMGKIVGRKLELEDYKLQSVTEGEDALGDATVVLRDPAYRKKPMRTKGRGLSTDVIESSLIAYINALNKLIYDEKINAEGK